MTGPDRYPRRFVLAGLMAAGGSAAFATAPERSIRPPPRGAAAGAAAQVPAAGALVEAAGLSGRVGFAVADARSGEVLEGAGAGLAMPPASVAKAATALYALESLGPGHRFPTRLVATGPIRNGRLEGDLVLVGGGDPVLGTDDLARMAQALKAAGLRELGGRFLYDDGALPHVRRIDPAQPEHVGYNPAVSGLNLNFNRVHFEWKRGQGGWQVEMDARSERYRPSVRMARMRIAERQGPVYTFAEADGVEDWTVASAALGTGGSRWLPVRRPGLYAAEVLSWFARAQGIVLPAPAPGRAAGGTVLVEHVSPPLAEIVPDMLKWSTNLTAEAIGLAASGAATLPASGERMARWLEARSGAQGMRFLDHSGLGEGSRIAPLDMVRILVAAGAEGPLRRMMKRIEMTDGQGRAVRGHPAQVAAKTGTLNFVSGLGGYVQAPSGRVMAFAIFAADLDRRARLGPEEMERPPGGRAWTGRARGLQQRLIERWVAAYG